MIAEHPVTQAVLSLYSLLWQIDINFGTESAGDPGPSTSRTCAWSQSVMDRLKAFSPTSQAATRRPGDAVNLVNASGGGQSTLLLDASHTTLAGLVSMQEQQ